MIYVRRVEVRAVYALGTTEHAADITDDGRVRFMDALVALREPDQLAVTPNGRFLVTADEGDTEPKASESAGPAGGSRTVSVLDARTGEVLGDTGNQLDAVAHRAGVYPDGRSDNRGSEPEGVVAFEAGGMVWAVVGLERADALALVSLRDPRAPQVEEVLPLRRPGDDALAPEGLAHIVQRGRHYIAVANERGGTVSIVRAEVD